MNSKSLVRKIVNRYIGVEGGFLGMPDKIRFTYKNHEDFYPEYCDLYKNPNDYEGTTRQKFISIFEDSTPKEQSRIILGILQRFPVSEKYDTRTEDLKSELIAEANKLEKINLVESPSLLNTSEVVFEALQDAETLIKERKSSSAVDRVHTAFHGYLRNICTVNKISFEEDNDLVILIKKILKEHSKFSINAKEQEIKNIIKSIVAISDSLNPIRNKISLAHANEDLIDEPEANLVINCVRTILIYLDTKLN